jgi:hypothetical protein
MVEFCVMTQKWISHRSMIEDVIHLPTSDLGIATIVDDASMIDPSTSEATSLSTVIKCPDTMLPVAASPSTMTLRSINRHGATSKATADH